LSLAPFTPFSQLVLPLFRQPLCACEANQVARQKEATAVLKPFCELVSSGMALVPESDSRAPVNLISAADFPEPEGFTLLI